MRVHICGVRGSTPAPGAEFLRYGGHTSCLAIAPEVGAAPALILDAGRTLGYRVSGGHAALAYIPDHCPSVLGPGPDGWGEYRQAALDLAAGVDLLVHDASLLPQEVAAEASFGHAAADYPVRLGELAGARRVLLAHHKHDRADDALDRLAARFRAGPTEVMWLPRARYSISEPGLPAVWRPPPSSAKVPRRPARSAVW